MKFTTEHYNILKGLLNRKACELVRYKAFHNLPNLYAMHKKNGKSFESVTWSLFRSLHAQIGDNKGLSSNCGISGDYNDAHIYTALKKYLREEHNIAEYTI